MRVALVALCAVVVAGACAQHETACNDDRDNDGDGLVDCADTDCALDLACTPCGDGHLDDDEACDDGNVKDGDGCSSRCLLEHCGDGHLDTALGEQCDDGNLVPGDGCNFRCKIDRCGNFVIEPDLGEECDDGNAAGGDGCSSQCKIERSAGPLCGNFQFDPGETCDDGNRNDGDGCSHLCQFEFCGDGVRQPAREQCDTHDGVPPGALCDPNTCLITHCGNNVVEPEFGEECDDGNFFFGDGCSACHRDRCGDFQQGPGEQCDDGNTSDGDGCSHLCRFEFCGDGIVQPRLAELCDGGADCQNCAPTRACSGALCFAISVDKPFLIPSTVALQPSAHRAWLGSSNNGLFVYDVGHGTLANGQFIGFSGIGTLAGGDIENDGVDEVAGGDSFGGVGLLDVNGFLAQKMSLADRIVDIAIGQAGGGARNDIVAVSRNGTVGVFLDGLRGHSTTVPFTPLHGIALPIVTSGPGAANGVVVAGGTHVEALHFDGTEALVGDADFHADAPVVDLAAADVDFDGADDAVALLDDDTLVAFFARDGALGTTAVFVADAPGALHLSSGDVDGDGLADLITSGNGGLVLHLAHDGYEASPALPAPFAPTRVDARDVDGDGDLDLFVAGGFPQPVVVLFLRE